MNAAQMTELTNRVVARFQDELAEADLLQLDHLAARAEARYASDLGARMRACVDFERARRTVTAGIGGAAPTSPFTDTTRPPIVANGPITDIGAQPPVGVR